MFHANVVKIQEAHFILCLFFFEKTTNLKECKRYDRGTQAIDENNENIRRRMRFECCTTISTKNHSKYLRRIAF